MQELVYEEVRAAQWEVVRYRLGFDERSEEERAQAEEARSTSWFPNATLDISRRERTSCVGIISLALSDYKEDKRVAIPLVRANRARLEALGFVISPDGLWATYVEPEEKEEK